MTENINIQIANCEENAWRRDNLLKVPHKIEYDNHYEVNFQYVEHTSYGVKQVRLIYKISK